MHLALLRFHAFFLVTWRLKISQFYTFAEVTMFAEVYRMRQSVCVCVHVALELIRTVGQGTAMYQLSSFRLIACELIMACLFIVSAQVMMLVYGTWTTNMPRNKKFCKATGGLYIYIWTETYIIGFLYICRKHITIWPYTRTTTHSRTHIYVHRHAQHEHSTYTSSQHHIPKHHLTHHNFTSHATRSVYLRLHTFTLLPPKTHITISPHTHTYTYV